MPIKIWVTVFGVLVAAILYSVGWLDTFRGTITTVQSFSGFAKSNPVEAAAWIKTGFTVFGAVVLFIFLDGPKKFYAIYKRYGDLTPYWSETDKRCSFVLERPRTNSPLVDREHHKRVLITNQADNSRSLENVEVLATLRHSNKIVFQDIHLRLRKFPPYSPITINPGLSFPLQVVYYLERPGLDSQFVFGEYSEDGLSWQLCHLDIAEYDIEILFAGTNMYPVKVWCTFGIKDSVFYCRYAF